MKTLRIILMLLLLAVGLGIQAKNPVTKSTLPLEISKILTNELINADTMHEQSLTGYVWMRFYVDDSGKVQIISLSSNNLNLGEYAKNQFSDLPEVKTMDSYGASYYVKLQVTF